MDEYFYGLPYVDLTGQVFGIVPVDEQPRSSRTPEAATNYEEPWYADSINRAIERAAQVATLEVAGYPQYPNYPLPTPQPIPTPMPTPITTTGVQPQQRGEGIQLSQTTLMLLVGGVLLFMLGKRGR
jgi:hypothetical protein